MSRDTKAPYTFVSIIVALWGSNIAYKFGYQIGYWNFSEIVDPDISDHIFGIFLAVVVILFPTYKLKKKYLWTQ